MYIITASPTVPDGCPGSLEAPSTTPSSGLAAPQLRNAGQLRPLGILSWGGPGNVRGLQRGVLGRRVGPNRGQSPSSLRLQASWAPKLRLIGAQLERELANRERCERSTMLCPTHQRRPAQGEGTEASTSLDHGLFPPEIMGARGKKEVKSNLWGKPKCEAGTGQRWMRRGRCREGEGSRGGAKPQEGGRFGTSSWERVRACGGKERREDLQGAGTAPKGFEGTLAPLPI